MKVCYTGNWQMAYNNHKENPSELIKIHHNKF